MTARSRRREESGAWALLTVFVGICLAAALTVTFFACRWFWDVLPRDALALLGVLLIGWHLSGWVVRLETAVLTEITRRKKARAQ